MVTSLDTEKAFNKTQHPFMIKIMERLGMNAAYLDIIKVIYEKSVVIIIFNEERLQSCHLD